MTCLAIVLPYLLEGVVCFARSWLFQLDLLASSGRSSQLTLHSSVVSLPLSKIPNMFRLRCLEILLQPLFTPIECLAELLGLGFPCLIHRVELSRLLARPSSAISKFDSNAPV